MSFFCRVCDRSVIENEAEYLKYLATLVKEKMLQNVPLIILNSTNSMKFYVIMSLLKIKILIFILLVVNW